MADEYAVYSAMLVYMMDNPTHSFGPSDRPARVVVVDQVPYGPDDVEHEYLQEIDRAFEAGIPRSVEADFKRKNASSMQLVEGHFDVPFECVLVGPETIDSLFSDRESSDPWQTFYGRYPGSLGIVNFSRVAFDQALTTAVVYAGQQRGWLAGEGGFYLLSREGGTWKVMDTGWGWVS